MAYASVEVVACANRADGLERTGGVVPLLAVGGEDVDAARALRADVEGAEWRYLATIYVVYIERLVGVYRHLFCIYTPQVLVAGADDGGEAHILLDTVFHAGQVGFVGSAEIDVVIEYASCVVSALQKLMGIVADGGIDGEETAEDDDVVGLEVRKTWLDTRRGVVFVELVVGVVVFVEESERDVCLRAGIDGYSVGSDTVGAHE